MVRGEEAEAGSEVRRRHGDDLSTGGVNLDGAASSIPSVPIGTEFVYQALGACMARSKSWMRMISSTSSKSLPAGCRYQTIHAGLLIEHLP